jgi:hypothetical protein
MMRLALVVLSALIMFMVAGGIPVGHSNDALVVFKTPIFTVLLVLLSGLLVACSLRYRRGVRGVLFLFAHLGVVAILIGAGIGRLRGVSGRVSLPVGGPHSVDSLAPPEAGGVRIPLGFRLAATTFDVSYHDPAYGLFRPLNDMPMGANDYDFVGDFEFDAKGVLQTPDYTAISRDQLWDEDMKLWLPQFIFTNGWVLQRGPLTPKHYVASLRISASNEVQAASLRVNAPVTVNGWRMYLMKNEQQPRPYIVCLLRRDPGRWLVISGIWLVIAGIAGLCWVPRRMCSTKGGAA